ncbi:MAG: hypothetical protein M3340_11525, partial [Actinomycetota bacterium]|nr:hypothetical protein [Actinomycetota bacterium]
LQLAPGFGQAGPRLGDVWAGLPPQPFGNLGPFSAGPQHAGPLQPQGVLGGMLGGPLGGALGNLIGGALGNADAGRAIGSTLGGLGGTVLPFQAGGPVGYGYGYGYR